MTTKPQISQQFSLSNISGQRLQISLLHDLDSNTKLNCNICILRSNILTVNARKPVTVGWLKKFFL